MWKWFQNLLFWATMLFGLAGQLHAASPLISVGKPSLQDILYSPNESYLATLTAQYVEFLDAETFNPVTRIEVKNGSQLLFSPDGSLLAVFVWREGIMLWDVPSKTWFATIPVKTDIFAFSPDGKYVAYALGDSIFLWDIAQKQTVRELTGDPQPQLKEWVTWDGEIKPLQAEQRVEAIAFYPNGRILAVGSLRPTIALWDVQTGEIRAYLKVGERAWAGWKMEFSHDGSLLAGQTSGNGLGLWDIAVEDMRHYRPGWKRPAIEDFVFTPDDRHLLVGNGNGSLGVIEVATFHEERIFAVDREPPPGVGTNPLSRVTIHPDGKRFASLVEHSRIVIWDTQGLPSNEVKGFLRLRTLYGWGQTQAEAVYLPKLNRIITGTYTSVLCFWDVTTEELVKTVEFHSTIYQLKASPDGSKFAIDTEATNQIWDAATEKPLFVFRAGGYLATTALEFSSSGKYLASNGADGTRIWNSETGKELKAIDTGWSYYPLLVFTPDEKQILVIPPNKDDHMAPTGDKVVFWDIVKGEAVREIRSIGPVTIFYGRLLQARVTEDAVEVVDLLSGRRLLSNVPKPEIRYKGDNFYLLQFSSTGKILVVQHRSPDWDTGEYRFYLTNTGQPIGTLSNVEGFRFVLNDEYMFITDKEGQLGLYQIGDIFPSLAVESSGKMPTVWGRIKRSLLFQNYPNPFNPETWIPFRLEEESNVAIRVYNYSGELVRVLALGKRKAGSYLEKSEAAYWDGRNEKGELVASGVYFYTIEAGDFTATLKMVVRK